MHRLSASALCLLAVCAPAVADPPAKPDPVTHYDPDPGQLWNRLHAALLTRPDRDGKTLGRDALDPHLFPTTKRLLEGQTHAEAVKLLDDFLAGGHALVRDPVKRAVLQRDLWAVFDWAAYPFGNYYTGGDPIKIRKGPLQERLAKAIRKLAPSKAEALPDTYALAVKAKAFPPAYDPAKPDAPFLPPDLFDPAGPWVCVTGPREMPTPVASEHAVRVQVRWRADAFLFVATGLSSPSKSPPVLSLLHIDSRSWLPLGKSLVSMGTMAGPSTLGRARH
jgi:hypothetical protein